MNNNISHDAPVLTIDGPSGVGKGTIAKMLAEKLGWHLLDSGALYRLTALAAKKRGVSFESFGVVAEIAANLDVSFQPVPDGLLRVVLDGSDVTTELRTEETGNLASMVASIGEVRAALLDRQRAFKEAPGLVADGRDMGTTVFPDAQFKVFLVADPEIRAKRRFEQLKNSGKEVSLSALFAEMKERDARDREREASPLKAAVGAVTIDTSRLSIEAVFQQVLDLLD